MARINLLPWREEARRERQRQFLYSLIGTLVLGAVLVLLVGAFFDQRISDQESRNQRIQVEINRLEKRIERIAELERTRDRLISRTQITTHGNHLSGTDPLLAVSAPTCVIQR